MVKTRRRKYTEAKLDLIKTGQFSGWGAKKIAAKNPHETWSVAGVPKVRSEIKRNKNAEKGGMDGVG